MIFEPYVKFLTQIVDFSRPLFDFLSTDTKFIEIPEVRGHLVGTGFQSHLLRNFMNKISNFTPLNYNFRSSLIYFYRSETIFKLLPQDQLQKMEMSWELG